MYSYRLIYIHPSCLSKRAVFFKDKRELSWRAAAKEGISYLSSQNCFGCEAAHLTRDYVMIECKRADPGTLFPAYTEIFPVRNNNDTQKEFNFAA